MELTMLKSKIHRATVTQAELDYIGSVTIDSELLRASGMLEYEKVLVVNLENGNRFETYTIAGEPGSGIICLNGAAAHLAKPGDKVIIMSFVQLSSDEAQAHEPTVVFVDDKNAVARVMKYEKHGRA